MKRRLRIALLGGLVALLATGCRSAQAEGPGPVVEPTSPPPAVPPPPPPTAPAQASAPVTASSRGQWVYTQQYGWVWIPYGDTYTYVPPDGVGEPLAYVYYPDHGWAWVVAPWLWGVGPWPFFGPLGPTRYSWYSHGWWRTPSRWHFRMAPARPGREELHAHGIRPAPVRARAPRAVGRHARGGEPRR